MKKSLVRFVVLFSVLTVTVSGQVLQENMPFDFVGGGARAEAMGNAYIGLSDDITAGSWNPAGLIVHEGPMLGVSYGSLSPRGFTNTNVQALVWRHEHSGSLNSISNLNFLAPIRIKGHPFVGSFNYTVNSNEFAGLGYSCTWDVPMLVVRNNIAVMDTFPVFRDVIGRHEGKFCSVNLSFGTRIYENVSFGFGVNIYTGETRWDTLVVDMVDDLPVAMNEQAIDVSVDSLTLDTIKFSGINFTVGLKITGERLSAGLIVRTPFDLNRKTGRSIYRVTYMKDLPMEGTQTDTTFYDNILTKYGMPLMIGAGIAYNVNDNFILTFDAEYRNFARTKVKYRESMGIDQSGNIVETFVDRDPEWNDVFLMRMGSEYLLDTKIGTIPLRAGIGFVPVPIPNRSSIKTPCMSYNFPHLIFIPFSKLLNKSNTPMRYTFSIGSGIQWSQIYLEWAYTYSILNRNYQWVESTEDMMLGTIHNRDHHFAFTFTGYF